MDARNRAGDSAGTRGCVLLDEWPEGGILPGWVPTGRGPPGCSTAPVSLGNRTQRARGVSYLPDGRYVVGGNDFCLFRYFCRLVGTDRHDLGTVSFGTHNLHLSRGEGGDSSIEFRAPPHDRHGSRRFGVTLPRASRDNDDDRGSDVSITFFFRQPVWTLYAGRRSGQPVRNPQGTVRRDGTSNPKPRWAGRKGRSQEGHIQYAVIIQLDFGRAGGLIGAGSSTRGSILSDPLPGGNGLIHYGPSYV